MPLPEASSLSGLLYGVKAEWAEARNDRFDWRGSLVYMLAMTSLMYGFSKIPGRVGTILTVIGVAGLILFVIVELKVPVPVLNISLFRDNKIFAFSNLAALINYAATFAITFVLSLYLQKVKGLMPVEAGMVLVTQPVLMAIVASISGTDVGSHRFQDPFFPGNGNHISGTDTADFSYKEYFPGISYWHPGLAWTGFWIVFLTQYPFGDELG